MAKASPMYPAFNGGEWSPLMTGRIDLEKYITGLEKCENYIPLVQGPVTRRPGSYFVSEVKDSSKATRLRRFEFSIEQAYMLELGDQYARFYRDHGRIETSPGVAYELSLPYLEADLFQLKFTQSADVLYVFHKDYAPRKITRTSHTNWSSTLLDFQDGPYLNTNNTATTMVSSGASGTQTLTASAVDGINDDQGFLATDVGRLVRLKSGASNWAWAKITAYTDTTHVTINIQGSIGAPTSATTEWRLGIYSDTTGYPVAGTFHDDRLHLGGSNQYPQTVVGSSTGDYENFAPTETDGEVLATNAYTATLNSNTVNAIRWMESEDRGLLIGTSGGEWVITKETSTSPFGPDNKKAFNPTVEGSKDVQAVRLGDATLFIKKGGRQIREMAYFFDRDKYRAPDLTTLAEHITGDGLIEMDKSQDPQDIMWSVREDGLLLGLTYEREQNVVSWHKHPFAGTNAKVKSVAVIPDPTARYDEVWVIVERTINGGMKKYVEYLGELWRQGNAQEDAFFVDGGLQYDGSATTTLSGLDHLEGESVRVLANGNAYAPDPVVSSGSITLEKEVTKASVGLGYASKMKTLKVEAGARDGTAQGKIKRMTQVVMRVLDMLGLSFGSSENDKESAVFEGQTDLQVALFSGDHRQVFNSEFNRDGQIYIEQDSAFPGTIIALMPRLVTEDDS